MKWQVANEVDFQLTTFFVQLHLAVALVLEEKPEIAMKGQEATFGNVAQTCWPDALCSYY